jgi:predicted nucleic acid-binding Zn ribbon protein
MAELSLGDALQQFLNKSRLKAGIQALQIEDVWEKLMGKTIAKYTERIKIINHTLFITTSVAPLKNELMFQKENIIKLINEELGAGTIKEVVVN